MTPHKIRNFLLQNPKPAALRVTTVEGDVHKITCSKGLKRCAETASAINPDLLECLDKEGELIRAHKVTDADRVDEGQQQAPPPEEKIELPAGLAADPQALAFMTYAHLLHRAYKDASSAAKHSTEVAFAKLVEIVERMGDRADSTEARLERVESAHRRTVEDRIDDAWERVDDELARAKGEGGEGAQGLTLESLFAQFAQGMAMRSGGAPKPNGAAKPNGSSNGANGKGS